MRWRISGRFSRGSHRTKPGLTFVVALDALTICCVVVLELEKKSWAVSSLFHSFVVVEGLPGGVIPWRVKNALLMRSGIFSSGVQRTGAKGDIVAYRDPLRPLWD